QITRGLIEVERHRLQSRDDVADAVRFRGVFEHVGGEESVAQRFDVQLRAVLVAVDLGQVEQIERDLVLQDSEVGTVFGGQLAAVEIGQTVTKLLVESALPGEILLAKIVQHLIEVLLLVLVQACRGSRGGGKGEGTVNELLGKRGQLLRGGFAAANGEQNHREKGSEFRHCLQLYNRASRN